MDRKEVFIFQLKTLRIARIHNTSNCKKGSGKLKIIVVLHKIFINHSLCKSRSLNIKKIIKHIIIILTKMKLELYIFIRKYEVKTIF